jgi:hypothetical protein
VGRVFSTNAAKNAYRILVGKPERKSPLRSPRLRWVNNNTIYLRIIGWDDMGWTDLAQDRSQYQALVNTVTNIRVP